MKKSNPNLILTGASSGVGYEIARSLSRNFHIIALSRRIEKMKHSFCNNPNITPIQCDLFDCDQLNSALSMIKNDFGDINHIINCAGVLQQEEIVHITQEKLYFSLQVNAISPLIIIKYFLPQMKKNNFGRIINLTSGAPLNCFPNFGLYSGSKALLNSLTITLAKELQDTNIKINLLSPGPVKSEMSPNATLSPKICIPMVRYLLNPKLSESGKFFWIKWEVPLFPNLEKIDWLHGKANHKLRRVLK